jgi:hypothetical protein
MMISRLRMILGLAVIALLSSSQSATAQIPPPNNETFVYEWFQVGGTSPVSGSFAVPQGLTISFEAWIRETSPTNLLSNAPGQENGLFSTGVRAVYGTPSILSIANLPSDIVQNLAFDDTFTSGATATDAQFVAARDFAAMEGVLPDANKRIYLGTFTFTASGGVGDSTTITLTDIPPTSQDTFTFMNSYFLDDNISNSNALTINITPVPEPALIFAMMLGCIGLFAVVKHPQAIFRKLKQA